MSIRTRPGGTLLVSGALGVLGSFVLLVERIHLLEDPSAQLACDVGPFVACAPVMTSPVAAIFGFPNPIFGLVCFTIAATTGVLRLSAVKLPRWYWATLSAGLVGASALITWLQYQSIAIIGSLCVWCMLVWAVTIPLVITTIGHSLAYEKILGCRGEAIGAFILRFRISIIALWMIAVAGAIMIVLGPRLFGVA